MSKSKRTLETLELVGGTVCLDFANTINSRREPEHDYLMMYSGLIDWVGKAEILPQQQARSLKQRAIQNSNDAEKTIEKGRTIREIIYRVFSAIANRLKPNVEDLEALTRLYGEAIANGVLAKAGDHYEINWKTSLSFDAPLWHIVASAGELLVSKELIHVKECPRCGWLFLDTSKNGSRRWCSMNTCGARDKMRTYHARMRRNK